MVSKVKRPPPSTGCVFCDEGDKPTNGYHYAFDNAVSATHSHPCRKKPSASPAIEEAVRLVDRITCVGCKGGFPVCKKCGSALGRQVKHHHGHANSPNDWFACTAKGHEAVAALVAEGWGKK